MSGESSKGFWGEIGKVLAADKSINALPQALGDIAFKFFKIIILLPIKILIIFLDIIVVRPLSRK